MRDHVKLFIPGPIDVSPDTYQAMAAPMIGHRSGDFQELSEEIQPGLQALFGTSRPIFLSTSSAWGVMEGALRNLAGGKKVLNCCSGAFSDKWHDVTLRCGFEADKLQKDWGQPLLPQDIHAKLETGDYDLLTLVHNETSTGVLNPVQEISQVMREFPDVHWIVDTVSSFSTVPVRMDEWGIDVILTGSQKALALPPGLALFAVSERSLDRSATVDGRGYYFDFHEFEKNARSSMTPSTPCISLLYGLRHQLAKIAQEGLPNRFDRHARLNAKVHTWVKERGFEFFAPEGYRSKSLTCVANNKGIDVPSLQKRMKNQHKIQLDGGYGKIKGTTFRLSNMGDETEASIQELLTSLNSCLHQSAG
ncbi:MAG: alanine--glyoxylate aminotransferase family protein [Verrucomicrobiota bacterium]